jgi:hypothetical protein
MTRRVATACFNASVIIRTALKKIRRVGSKTRSVGGPTSLLAWRVASKRDSPGFRRVEEDEKTDQHQQDK